MAARWPRERVERVAEMWRAGMTAAKIADRLLEQDGIVVESRRIVAVAAEHRDIMPNRSAGWLREQNSRKGA